MHGGLDALLKALIAKAAFGVLAVIAILLALVCTWLILRKVLRKRPLKTKLIAGCLLAPVLSLLFAFAIVSVGSISLFYFWAKPENKRLCIRNMQSIAEASRNWAKEHEGRVPENILSLSNSFPYPQVLICPATGRFSGSWSQFPATDSSYQLAAPRLRAEDTNAVFLRCMVHRHGAYIDGRVIEEHTARKL